MSTDASLHKVALMFALTHLGNCRERPSDHQAMGHSRAHHSPQHLTHHYGQGQLLQLPCRLFSLQQVVEAHPLQQQPVPLQETRRHLHDTPHPSQITTAALANFPHWPHAPHFAPLIPQDSPHHAPPYVLDSPTKTMLRLCSCLPSLF